MRNSKFSGRSLCLLSRAKIDQFVRMDPERIINLLLRRANDVEVNPGPGFQDKIHTLERLVNELQREHRTFHKTIEHQALQIVTLSRHQNRASQSDDVLARVTQDMLMMRETLESQATLLKRQMAQMAAMTCEMNSLKKLNVNQKNELKQLNMMASLESKAQPQDSDNKACQTVGHQEKSAAAVAEECQIKMETLTNAQAEVTSQLEDLVEKVQEIEKNARGSVAHLERVGKNNATSIKGLNCTINMLREESGAHKTALANIQKEQLKMGTQNVAMENQVGRLNDDLISVKGDSQELLEGGKNKIANLEMNLYNTIENVSDLSDKLDASNTSLDGLMEDVKDQIKGHSKFFQDVISEADKDRLKFRQELNAELRDMREEQSILHDQMVQFIKRNADENNGGTRKVWRNLEERMDTLDWMYEDIQDRVFEIDKNRKNNLVFYGINGDELDQDDCESRIRDLLNTYLQVTREIPLTKVQRMWNGPSFRGFKPVLVCFQLFRDKEDILRKAYLLKGTNTFITEDFSRKVRKAREELVRFARESRALNPAVKCALQYDRLLVDNEAYLYNSAEGKVQRVLMKPTSLVEKPPAIRPVSRIPIAKSQGCQTPVLNSNLRVSSCREDPHANRGFGDGVSSSDEEMDLVYSESLTGRPRHLVRLRHKNKLPKSTNQLEILIEEMAENMSPSPESGKPLDLPKLQ
ncbi:myosin-11-like [Tigriopus californicus]|uniref:myosin-11-like n=1 Tax=Tigriopus californicus TaxID=6832 RepID=UPI0027D9D90C|nr:myosin-11-like [Tigriopus californicus]